MKTKNYYRTFPVPMCSSIKAPTSLVMTIGDGNKIRNNSRTLRELPKRQNMRVIVYKVSRRQINQLPHAPAEQYQHCKWKRPCLVRRNVFVKVVKSPGMRLPEAQGCWLRGVDGCSASCSRRGPV